MNEVEQFYNKFNEDKRLKTRHGRVEHTITMNYIERFLEQEQPNTLIDIGAATGAYSLPLLSKMGNVISIDLVKYNLGILKKNYDKLLADNPDNNYGELTCYKRDARKLRGIEDNTSDMTLLLGPMYHLCTLEDRRKALSEAIRVTKDGGLIFVAYIMNDYAILMHGFFEHTILEDIEVGNIDRNWAVNNEDKIYSFVRLEDIDMVNEHLPVEREIIFSPDGAANHMRPVLNSLSEEEFQAFIEYQQAVSARADLLGASAHTVDVLRVRK